MAVACLMDRALCAGSVRLSPGRCCECSCQRMEILPVVDDRNGADAAGYGSVQEPGIMQARIKHHHSSAQEISPADLSHLRLRDLLLP